MQGRWWALHVLEAPWAWLLAAVYIAATVISTHPPFISIANVSSIFPVNVPEPLHLMCSFFGWHGTHGAGDHSNLAFCLQSCCMRPC